MMWGRLLLFVGVVTLVTPSWAVVCPGGKMKCADGMTCCPLANHQFGCCTYPDAQCCQDRVHCCPHGMKCDERHQACLKNGFPALSFSQTTVKPELVEDVVSDDVQRGYSVHTNDIIDLEDNDNKICPDGHQCPSSFTCCKMFRGRYGCCPYSDAKCCRDGFHCCPHGSECDPFTGGCEDGNSSLKILSMNMEKPSTPDAVDIASNTEQGIKCPDGHPCLDKFTCCKVQSGGYGCCPYADAICCTDLIHCCPKNTNCNNSKGTCDTGRGFSVPSFSLATMKLSDMPPLSGAPSPSPSVPTPKAGSVPTDLKFGDVSPNTICPDHRSQCSPGATCCLTASGLYGCCPMPMATCCADRQSCCPHGYRCTGGGMCQRVVSIAALPFLPPITVEETHAAATSEPSIRVAETPAAAPSGPSIRVEEDQHEETINCLDGSQCPDQTTCCNVSPTRFGCCPMPLATCCGDMKHCCPHGYWCADEGCERVTGDTLNKTLISHTSLESDSFKVMMAP